MPAPPLADAPRHAAVTRIRRQARLPDGLDLRLIDLDAGEPLDALLGQAAPEERERAGRYRSPLDRRRYLARRLHLRRAVGERLGLAPESVRFGYGPFGKPFVEGAALGVSLSHSDGVALMALADDLDVGCDIERIDDAVCWRDAERAGTLAPSEVRRLAGKPPAEALACFFEIWTLKEAGLKCLGLGLSSSASGLVVAGEGPDEAEGDLSACVLRLDPAFAAAAAWTPRRRYGPIRQ